MTQEAKNIDQILVQDMQERLSGESPKPVQMQEPVQEQQQQQEDVQVEHDNVETEQKQEGSSDPYNLSGESSKQEESASTEQHEESSNSKESSPIDEYGNPVQKPKLYTEEEVQQRIRDRLSRGKYAKEEQQQQQQQQRFTQQQVNQANADGFQHDANSEESWEVQLENFINQTIEKRQAKAQEEAWRQQEYEKQMEFQDKFSSGMSKYKDFHEVVAGKPITDSMMLATRSMENPAAFVYAASKLHPQELERISRINDPYVQASEVGRLHERMIKERKAVTNAPKPLKQPTGDVPGRVVPKMPSIDQRIAEHAKQKRR